MKKTFFILFLLTAVSCTLISEPPEPLPTVSPQQHIIFHNGSDDRLLVTGASVL